MKLDRIPLYQLHRVDERVPLSDQVGELSAPQREGKTLEAVADHGGIDGDTVTGRADLSAETLGLLSGVGVDVDDVYDTLEREGSTSSQPRGVCCTTGSSGCWTRPAVRGRNADPARRRPPSPLALRRHRRPGQERTMPCTSGPTGSGRSRT